MHKKLLFAVLLLLLAACGDDGLLDDEGEGAPAETVSIISIK